MTTENHKTVQSSDEMQPLPVSRGFVIQIEASANISQGQFCGRIEHIVTGKSTWFISIKEMLAFIDATI